MHHHSRSSCGSGSKILSFEEPHYQLKFIDSVSLFSHASTFYAQNFRFHWPDPHRFSSKKHLEYVGSNPLPSKFNVMQESAWSGTPCTAESVRVPSTLGRKLCVIVKMMLKFSHIPCCIHHHRETTSITKNKKPLKYIRELQTEFLFTHLLFLTDFLFFTSQAFIKRPMKHVPLEVTSLVYLTRAWHPQIPLVSGHHCWLFFPQLGWTHPAQCYWWPLRWVKVSFNDGKTFL